MSAGRMREGVPPPKYIDVTEIRFLREFHSSNVLSTMRMCSATELLLEIQRVARGHTIMVYIACKVFVEVAVGAEAGAVGIVQVHGESSCNHGCTPGSRHGGPGVKMLHQTELLLRGPQLHFLPLEFSRGCSACARPRVRHGGCRRRCDWDDCICMHCVNCVGPRGCASSRPCARYNRVADDHPTSACVGIGAQTHFECHGHFLLCHFPRGHCFDGLSIQNDVVFLPVVCAATTFHSNRTVVGVHRHFGLCTFFTIACPQGS